MPNFRTTFAAQLINIHRKRTCSSYKFMQSSQKDNHNPVLDCSQVKSFKEIPGPRRLPYFGSLFDYMTGTHDYRKMREILKSFHDNYGPVVKETRSGDTFVHLFHLDDICGVLRNSQVQTDVYPLFPALGFYRRWRRIGPGIGNVNGEEWHTLRGLVQSHILRPNIVADYLPFINEVADDFLTRLPDTQTANGEVPNLYEEVAKWHLKSTARNVFETHPGFFDNEVNEFFDVRSMIEATQTVVRSATRLYYSLPLYRYVRTAQWDTMVESADYLFGGLQKLLDRAVDDIKVLSATNQLPDDKYSFLRHVMSRSGDIPYSEWGMLSLDMVFDGLIATPAVLIWNLFTLSKHSHVQDKLFEEVERIVPRGENVRKDHIKKMKYMKAFLKETSRFFPLTVELTRIPQQDTVVGGYHIPKGTILSLNSLVFYHSPEYFVAPEQFQPERWLRENTSEDYNPYTLLPFGHGTRMCLGRRFAEHELSVMLVKTLQRYRLQWVGSVDMGQEFHSVHVPDCPARVKFIERQEMQQ